MSDIVWGVRNANGSETEIFKRISWGAIFSGVLVALGVELVFLLFGLFVGFQMSGGTARVWSTTWTLIGLFVSLLVGAWVASRLSGNPNRGNGMLHGFVVWGVTIFTTFVLATGLLWSVVREGTSVFQTAVTSSTAVVPPTGTNAAPDVPAPPPVPTQQNMANLANDISSISLRLFIGLLVAAAGALIGGAAAAPRDTDFTAHHHSEPVRPAA